MNYFIEIGIFVVAVGSLITYIGSKKDSDNSQKQVTDKLDSFNELLETATKSSLNSADKQEKIKIIKSEFDDWAKNLIDNYPEFELSHDKTILSESEKRLTANKTLQPIFSKVFHDLFQLVNSINNETVLSKISIHSSNSVFPKDIFSKTVDKYFTLLEFSPTLFLKVRISTVVSSNEYSPIIKFILYESLEEVEKDFLVSDILYMYFDNDQTFFISKEGTFDLFESNAKSNRYPITEITDIVKKIIQYLFIISNKKK